MWTRAEAEASLEPTLDRLARLAELGSDWDSYGGAPPSGQALATARELLFAVAERCGELVGERVRPYAVAPIADGGVQLEWRGAHRELELEIGPGGDVGYLLVERHGGERQFEEGDDLSWPKALDLVARVLTPQG
jgi:hypothetical protein